MSVTQRGKKLWKCTGTLGDGVDRFDAVLIAV